MKRILFSALLAIATILFSQDIRADADHPLESEPAFMNSGSAEWSSPDEPIGSTTVIAPEEPPTILLVIIGLIVLGGIGGRSRKDHHLESPTPKRLEGPKILVNKLGRLRKGGY
jgi:hypothetical protein